MPFQKGNKLGIGNKYALGLKHTVEWKEEASIRQKGNSHAKGMKPNSTSFKKGEHPSKVTEFKKGNIPWIKGKPHLQKEQNPNWKGGVSTNNKLERIRFRNTMQKQVFKRDNYTCQLCGSKKDLQVDHIQSWSEYIELRFNLDNCRTLCAKCHYFITFGKKMPNNIKVWGHNLKHVIERKVD